MIELTAIRAPWPHSADETEALPEVADALAAALAGYARARRPLPRPSLIGQNGLLTAGLFGAATLLIRSGRQSGSPPWGKLILIGLYLVPAVSRYVAKMWHASIGNFALLVLLALACTHAWREWTLRRPGEDNVVSPGASGRSLAGLP